jgi:DnaK suppressor protein
MAKKTLVKAAAKPAPKAKPKKPAPKVAAKVAAKKPAPKPAPAKSKAKPAPAKSKAAPRPAPAKPAPKPAPKKAAPPPAKTPDNKPAGKNSVTSSIKPKSMSSTATTKTVTPANKSRPKGTSSAPGAFAPYELKKGEDYMNDSQKDHFKKILLNWRAELMQEVDRTVHHMQDEAANPPDPADRATLEEEFSIELRTRDRERRLIKKIDSTIELIANDDYGYCDSCGVEIGIRRLEARPTANKCIDCKTLDEIKEKQLGSP